MKNSKLIDFARPPFMLYLIWKRYNTGKNSIAVTEMIKDFYNRFPHLYRGNLSNSRNAEIDQIFGSYAKIATLRSYVQPRKYGCYRGYKFTNKSECRDLICKKHPKNSPPKSSECSFDKASVFINESPTS